MKRIYILAALLLCLVIAACGRKESDELSVIPVPREVRLRKGSFIIDEQVTLRIDAPQEDKSLLEAYIKVSPIANAIGKNPSGGSIVLELKSEVDGLTHAEGYVLTVDCVGVKICAPSGAGLFYGLQTLMQMMDEDGRVRYCSVVDEPRFDYRGMMLDVSRHFYGVDCVKKQIDVMAAYKLNHLHLHLTDAAGWRIEIERYPRLTELAAWRTHDTWKEWWNGERHYVESSEDAACGGYYTQADIRDIVDYAQQQYITVIPEIEMPSHSEEVLVAYPELSCTGEAYKQSDFCAGKELTFEFLENVLSEVIELFPSEYIHIGGDEASKQAWKSCPHCQQRMADEGLTDVDQLQSYFIRRIERFLNSRGRKLLGWDEILDGGLAPNATVMSWRGTEGGLKAMQMGHRAIMTPGEFCYFDSYQDAPHTQPEAIGGYLSLEKVYSYEPLPDTLDKDVAQLLYGVQANLFTEYVPTEEHLEYMLYPRMLALAEVAWSTPERRDYEYFRLRALNAVGQLRMKGYNVFDLSKEVGNRPGAEKPVQHLAVGKEVTYMDGSAYYSGYTAGGDTALVDGVRGGWTYGDKRWQGFLGRKGVDVVIDLEQMTKICSVSADFMQICGPGVFMPAQVVVSVSVDGENYIELQTIDNEVVRDDEVTFKTLGWEGSAEARYVRYQARRSDFGGFLFIDEVVVR